MKNLKNKALVAMTAVTAGISTSSFAAVDANVQAGLDQLVATGGELSQAGLTAIIALGVVSVGIAVVIGILRWVKRSATN
ncbi:hypothetical protein Q9F29_004081 [Vibrio parahaemolyticus]|uniref:hypothetical protein n=1 Tax=Vibrio parahaemolyticus TaxID=670 RepID=UPI00226B2EC8|nr:hypothetical protein [Vibrio parahaemolyticus]ELA7411698.1 hypothetical protein [Vibrio parahaemolyticus]MCX8856249.1 hypothetical protein [Vibrio parahaemolyticus]MCX8897492.1 hypothetical protein [Vibrio parahaemolyticus]MCX8917918.1 hypothetical protein [Vibrio parahaemolyticus]